MHAVDAQPATSAPTCGRLVVLPLCRTYEQPTGKGVRLPLSVFYFFLFIATMSFAGYFLIRSLLSAFPAYLRTYFRFDLVWFRLSVCVCVCVCVYLLNCT